MSSATPSALRVALAPHRALRHAPNRVLAIDVDAVEAAALERAANRFQMRQQVGVLDEHRKCFGHENRDVEGALGKSELLDRPAVEAKIREIVRFAPPRRDHRGRAIDADDLESVAVAGEKRPCGESPHAMSRMRRAGRLRWRLHTCLRNSLRPGSRRASPCARGERCRDTGRCSVPSAMSVASVARRQSTLEISRRTA